jgi:hypothetical protein
MGVLMRTKAWIAVFAALVITGCIVPQPTEVVEQSRPKVPVEKQAYTDSNN